MKTPAKNYKGIVYVQLNELPVIQQELILKTVHKDLFIKIIIGKKIVSSCLQYMDYEHWYNNVYTIKAKEKSTVETTERTEVLITK